MIILDLSPTNGIVDVATHNHEEHKKISEKQTKREQLDEFQSIKEFADPDALPSLSTYLDMNFLQKY